VAFPSEKAEQEKLIQILPYLKYVAAGIDGKPTFNFSGVNLQVIDGSGAESILNGTGNLVLGMTKNRVHRPGRTTSCSAGLPTPTPAMVESSRSHNNTISGPYASVLGGAENTATGTSSTITGGHSNKSKASTPLSMVAAGTSPVQAPSLSTPSAPTRSTPTTSRP